MTFMSNPYPWYSAVSGNGIEQGDILKDSPVFIPPAEAYSPDKEYGVGIELCDTIIMTQSCDLVAGRTDKVKQVLLCPIYTSDEIQWGKKDLEEARKGRYPAYLLINSCDLPGLEMDCRIVDFRTMYTLPIATVRNHAMSLLKRIRLMPPYKEHLSQAYARFLMRVGLPIDIPPFK